MESGFMAAFCATSGILAAFRTGVGAAAAGASAGCRGLAATRVFFAAMTARSTAGGHQQAHRGHCGQQH